MSTIGNQLQPEILPTSRSSNTATTTIAINDHAAANNKQRNYQVFPGQNRFFCQGRLMTSREYWAFLTALVILLVPSALFFAFTCPWLWINIHPSVPIIFAYLFVLAMASMLKTSWTDPGIVPRNLHPMSTTARDHNRYSVSYDDMWPQNMPLPKEVQVKDQIVRLKYCDTCQLYRPPRASHCRQCNNCVENEDHHCIWLNNCIGRRNYRSFFVFVTVATLMCFYAFAFSFVHVYTLFTSKYPYSFVDALAAAPLSFVVFLLCFVLMWSVGGLSGYHCYLVMRNVTTHEQLRNSVMSRPYPPNPFNFGNAVSNFWYVLCRPQPKSYIGRRKQFVPSSPYPSAVDNNTSEPVWNYG
ncbi:hypothetical protein K450DRAFT_229601 [Umbelopsis ramanniana AG]|uniref:Palmitoyltransferase n=1 Tax=Umbelopsis ramanniana AG TaxID=1314678 RepID=A0AAD5EGI4_UMBRA|nr:uncharacterized protein K450DRAFT_229601 [Umbelopsis ramanniana AG]KAI8581860.1 hypothetical protein K450DRAFT_229601 [Umbelopsis ramanniana AG]